MKKLIAYYGDTPVCVEGFPENCKRSVKGALHLLPRKSMTVTADEHAHILSAYKHVVPKLKVLAEMNVEEGSKEEAAAQPSAEVEAPASEPVSVPAAEAVEESREPSGDSQKKKKRF